MSSAYHPQTDGQTEVVNKCIEQFLCCFVHKRPKQWSFLLFWAEFWYNTTYHSSIGMTPLRALYGRDPPTLIGYETGTTPIHELDEQLREQDEIINTLKQHFDTANNRMKQADDSKRRDITLVVGDWVFLRLQPYRQHTVFRRSSHKLSVRHFGPFQVEARIGPVAYRLKLPEGSRIHPVFHVSLLKKRIGSDTPTSLALPPLRSTGELRLTPARILDFRNHLHNNTYRREALVLWHGLSTDEATLEDLQQLQRSFPNFNLEDKVPFNGRCNGDTISVNQSLLFKPECST